MVNVTSETLMHFIIEKIALDFVSFVSVAPVLVIQEFNFKKFLSSCLTICFSFSKISELNFKAKCFSNYFHLKVGSFL